MQTRIAPTTMDTIDDDFAVLDDWEDRYRYIIELGRKLPPLAPAQRVEANKVKGCASQVWLVRVTPEAHPDKSDKLCFVGESDSHIVQGLIAILLSLVNGKSAAELASEDIAGRFGKLGLKEHLTPQRSNGLASMIARIKAEVSAIAAT